MKANIGGVLVELVKTGKIADYNNSTYGTFRGCERPSRTPDYISDSGSMYWEEEDRLIRCSDHWGRGVGMCHWYLWGNGKEKCKNYRKKITAYIPFSQLKRIVVDPPMFGGKLGYWTKSNGFIFI